MLTEVQPGRRLLLVEDDSDLRDAISDRLSDAGFHVQAEPNGHAALQRLRAGSPTDVIVLDLMMPVMNGWEFRIQQRGDPVLSRIPVVVLTANTTPQAKAIDADARLEKPFAVEELLHAIEQAVSAKHREQAAQQQAHAERLISLGSLAAGILHEVGNPLAAVLANADLAQTAIDRAWPECRAELEQQLRDIREAAEMAVAVVREASALSRMAEQEELVEVADVLAGAIAIMRSGIAQRARHVAEHQSTARVRARRSRLLQVFVNLLVNALHAFEPGQRGLVTTRLYDEPGSGLVVVEVVDSGRGISIHARDHIFEPFFTTKSAGSGTGLGLSMCRRIVHDLGGQIRVESEPGRGTTFRIELPIATDEPRSERTS